MSKQRCILNSTCIYLGQTLLSHDTPVLIQIKNTQHRTFKSVSLESPGVGVSHSSRIILRRREATSKWPEHLEIWSNTPFLCQTVSKWPQATLNQGYIF